MRSSAPPAAYLLSKSNQAPFFGTISIDGERARLAAPADDAARDLGALDGLLDEDAGALGGDRA